MTSEELDIYLLALEIYYDMILKDFPEDLTKELHEFIIDLEKRWVTIDGRHVNIGGDDSSGGGSSGDSENDSAADKLARHLYNRMTREEREEVIQKGQQAKKPIFSYDRPDNKAMSYLQKVPKEANTFDVFSHGSPDFIEFFRQDYPEGDRRSTIDAYTLSCILKGRKDYKAFIADCKKRDVKPTVRLLSCNTGNTTNTGNCFAQLLANELGHNVTAPTDLLLAYPNGKIKVGKKGQGKMKPFCSRKN